MTCSGLRALPSTVAGGLSSTAALSGFRRGPASPPPETGFTSALKREPLRISRAAAFAPCVHATAIAPAGSARLYLLIIASCTTGDADLRFACRTSAFPRILAGRLLHLSFRGLLSVHSRYKLHTRSPPKRGLCIPCSQHFAASASHGTAAGWKSSKSCRVGSFTSLNECTFPRRTKYTQKCFKKITKHHK